MACTGCDALSYCQSIGVFFLFFYYFDNKTDCIEHLSTLVLVHQYSYVFFFADRVELPE